MVEKYGVFWPLAVVLVCGADAGAQSNVVIQLPTFHRFSMSTTVLVPDGGAVYLGGVGSTRQYARNFGPPLFPPAIRSRGGRLAASDVSVRASIHDLNELDEAVLAEWEKRKSSTAASNSLSISRSRLTSTAGGRSGGRSERPLQFPDPPPVSLSDLRASRHARQEANRRQSAEDYQRGLDMEAKGKLGVARIYYGMALKNAAGPLQDEIKSRLERAEPGRGSRVARVR